YFRFQSFGDLIAFLLKQDAVGDAGERLPYRRHVGMRLPVPFAKILLVDQVTVAHHDQAAMLAGFLDKLERLIESAGVDAGTFTDTGGAGQCPPAALSV